MLALQASGHRIVNLACGLGRPEDRERRRVEALESSKCTGFELIIPGRPVAIGSGDDLEAARAELATQIAELVRAEEVEIVFSPSLHDRHPGHEVVGRATLAALSSLGDGAPAWWMWGLWADLPFPTLSPTSGPSACGRSCARWTRTPVSWGETTTGGWCEAGPRPTPSWAPSECSASGLEGARGELAELATEVVFRDGDWLLGTPRELDPREPLVEPTRSSVSAWLSEPSLTQRFGSPGP